MAGSLFSPEQWPTARRLSTIVYCNPFEEARWDLERECLGADFQERARYLAPGESEELLAPNLKRLMEIAVDMMETARLRLGKGCEATDAQLAVYENLAHFVVFHQCMAGYDRLIENSWSRGRRVSASSLFERYRDRLRHFMDASDATRFSPQKECLYFGLYFQLRRAWMNIYRYLVGGSDAISQLRSRIWSSIFTHDMQRYQRSLYGRLSDAATLITGDSGTGKELVARAIGMSLFVPYDERSGGFAIDFVDGFYPLNLSALSPTLIESELFGHCKGSFTGALQDKQGYFEECGPCGAVFLDEVGDTDPSIQVKLLRVLQTRQFQRLGDTQLKEFGGKVLAATNKDLAEEIGYGRFREDFYFRLCADRIRTPSLKEILSDKGAELELLVRHIAAKLAGPADGEQLAEESVGWIRANLGPHYGWPGNFRELEQCVRSILIQGKYEIERLGVSTGVSRLLEESSRVKPSAAQLLSLYARDLYREVGSYEETARVLQVDRRTAKRHVLGEG